MVVVSSANPSMQLIAATRPAHWTLQSWQDPIPSSDLIVLCEENTFPSLPPHAVAIVLDSVRYPKDFLKNLPNKVITLDAPANGCTFLWTPIRAELFKPKPWNERVGVICPVRLKNYPPRQKCVERLQKIGVKIIERDDKKRSYQDYVDDLCSAKAVINFCQDRKTGKPQLKGRVLETLTAGALLFEELNYCTRHTLPGAAYFGWEKIDDLAILYDGLIGGGIGESTARHGREVARDFSSEKFWRNVETIAHE